MDELASEGNPNTHMLPSRYFDFILKKLRGRKYIFTIKTSLDNSSDSANEQIEHCINYMRTMVDIVHKKQHNIMFHYVYEFDSKKVLHIHGTLITFGYALNMKKTIQYKDTHYPDHHIDIQVMDQRKFSNWINYIFKDEKHFEHSKYLSVGPHEHWLSDDHWAKTPELSIVPGTELHNLVSPEDWYGEEDDFGQFV